MSQKSSLPQDARSVPRVLTPDMDGVDVFFIGPSDLSQSMGHPSDLKAPRVAKAIDETLRRIVTAGKVPGMPASTDAVQGVLSRGVRYVYTHTTSILGAGAAAYLNTARK